MEKFIQRVIRTKRFISNIVIGLFGLLLAVLGYSYAEGNFAVVVITLGVTILTSTSVSVLSLIFGTDIVSQIEERYQFDRSVLQCGLSRIEPDERNESFFDDLSQSHTIDMMFNTGGGALRKYGSDMAKAITKNKCNIRILMSHEDSILWNEPTIADGICPNLDVPMAIKSAKDQLNVIIKEIGLLRIYGTIEARYYECVPNCSLVIVDNRKIRYTPYMPYKNSHRSPVFEFFEPTNRDLFDKYVDNYNDVWEKSKDNVILRFPNVVD